jgi:hypothetical protein
MPHRRPQRHDAGGTRVEGLGRVAVTAADDRCSLRIPGRAATVTASVSTPPEAFVEWE